MKFSIDGGKTWQEGEVTAKYDVKDEHGKTATLQLCIKNEGLTQEAISNYDEPIENLSETAQEIFDDLTYPQDNIFGFDNKNETKK